MPAPSSAWDPDQYERFKAERAQPFYDLVSLVERDPGMRVIDLGCGTGQLTAWLHGELAASETLGIDAAETMLAQAAEHGGGGVRFERADIASFEAEQPYDLVLSNAALQWVEDHESLVARVAAAVAPGGQLAVQVPANDDHPSHVIARALASSEFRDQLDGYERVFPILTPVRYAQLLFELGFMRQQVRMQVYAHVLPDTRAVIEWVKGSLLTPFRERLSAEDYARFLERYEHELLTAEGDRQPYLYPFKRILMWGRRTAEG